MEIFDSHVHFVDPRRPEGIVWPARNSPIYGPHFPQDLVDSARPANLSGCVAVETSRRPEDDTWLLKLAQNHSIIKGVVLNLQPDLEDFEERLEQAAGSDKFVGIRFRPIRDYHLDSSLLLRNIALIQKAQKTSDRGG